MAHSTSKPRFSFLVLEEHPWGRAMLRRLLNGGHIPQQIIQEKSAVADEERAKFLARMEGQPAAPTLAEQAARHRIPLQSVPNHNDPACLEFLQSVQPDLVVLGGTRIIRRNILALLREGQPVPFVNAHPGLLPWLRGSASVGWALYLDLPMGATVHFIDPNIDTGDIILRRELPVTRQDTYETINYRVAELAAKLMTETLDRFAAGSVPRQPQDTSVGKTYRVIPEDLLAEGKARLAQGRYAHYSDGSST
jgi:methionyl-tRNA formyltransferase